MYSRAKRSTKLSAHLRNDTIVVTDRGTRRYRLIRPAVPKDQLSATGERRKIRVVRIKLGRQLLLCKRHVTLGIEGLGFPSPDQRSGSRA